MSSLFELNIGLISGRWPDLAERIVTASVPPSAFIDRSGRQESLVYEGIHLSSGEDRDREARLQASLVPEGSREAWVYGFGSGDLPRALLGRSEVIHLHVVVMNYPAARFSLASLDHSDWLSDPRTELVMAERVGGIHFPFAASPACLRIAEEDAARLRDLVVLELSTPHIRSKYRAEDAGLRERLASNESFVVADRDVADLFGTQAGATIVIAGAGPTLGRHFQTLRRKRSACFLIAVDAALRPLLVNGLIPDAVLCIDGHEKIVSFFEGLDPEPLRATALVYFPVIHPRILRSWPGPRLAAYPDHPLYADLAVRRPRATLYCSGSVIHPAIDLGVKSGAAKVILAGADFSFPGSATHVEGCVVRESVKPAPGTDWVVDGHGGRVSTTPAMRGYLRDLEGYIAGHPEVIFINGSRDGAAIRGTECREEPL